MNQIGVDPAGISVADADGCSTYHMCTRGQYMAKDLPKRGGARHVAMLNDSASTSTHLRGIWRSSELIEVWHRCDALSNMVHSREPAKPATAMRIVAEQAPRLQAPLLEAHITCTTWYDTCMLLTSYMMLLDLWPTGDSERQ